MKKKAKEFLKLQKKKKIQLDGTTEGTVAAIKNEMYNKIIIEIGDQEYDPNEICEVDIKLICSTICSQKCIGFAEVDCADDANSEYFCKEVKEMAQAIAKIAIKFKETNE